MKGKIELEDLLNIEADKIRNIPYKHKLGDVTVEVKPVTLGQIIQLHPLLVKIAKEDMTAIKKSIEDASAGKKEDFDDMVELFAKYGQVVISIILVIVGEENRKAVENATFDDLYSLFAAVAYRLGTQNFKKSIIHMQRISLSRRQEIIACSTRLGY